MPPMSSDQTERFLAHGTRTGKLATVRADGRPHVAPIWFVLDGDDLLFNTAETSVKGRNLRRDPRAAIAVDDQTPPYSHVVLEGTVQLITDLDEVRRWATKIGARYMGDDRAEEFGERNGVEGELLVRFTPTRVVAEGDVSD
jgi:hypothetical protein